MLVTVFALASKFIYKVEVCLGKKKNDEQFLGLIGNLFMMNTAGVCLLF